MICPNCGETLRERERAGVEVDVCPACRGMWLDRGELDELIDRESRYNDGEDWGEFDRPRERAYAGDRGRDSYPDREYRDRDRGRNQPPPQQKKKGFFQSIVETFGEGGEGGMGD